MFLAFTFIKRPKAFPGKRADDLSIKNVHYFFSGEVGIVAGWGRLSEGGKLPNILQYVSTKVTTIDILRLDG